MNSAIAMNSSYDVKCMYECQEVSNTALHNFPRPQTLKKEIRNENQDQRKIFDPGGIWTHDLRIRSPSLYQLSYEAKLGVRYPSADRWAGRLSIAIYIIMQSA